MTDTLKANKRGTRASQVHHIRDEEHIPGILYGYKQENQPVEVDGRAFLKLYRDVGKNGVLTLKLGDDDHQVMVQDMQVDPLKREILHIDFYQVNMKETVDAEVPVQLHGDAPGDKEGGVVQQLLHDVTVRALPDQLPDHLSVTIDHLNIGDSISVRDLKEESDHEIINDDEEIIVSVTPPTTSGAVADDETDEEEPEIVGDDTKE